MKESEARGKHVWKFFRSGGLDQVMFRDGQDIACLEQLDQKLWVALSCPVRGLVFDVKTLELIDSDKDGRIRARELLTAIEWTIRRIKDPNDLMKGAAALPLAAIDSDNPEGAKLLAGARRILDSLGRPDSPVITLSDIADTSQIFAQTRLNGDGIVPAHASQEPEIRAVIEEIITCVGEEVDRSGSPGVSQAKLDAFFSAAQEFSDWWAKEAADARILPLEAATGEAYESIQAVRVKVEDYFTRCSVAAFDPRAAGPMNRAETEYATMALTNLTAADAAIVALPIARIEPDRPLPLREGINPAWAEAVERLRVAAVEPLYGKDRAELTAAEWRELCERFVPYAAWIAAKSGAAVEKLGLARVQAILAGNARARIAELIVQDASLADEFSQINEVGRLIRYYRDLNRLVNNFVNLADFYDPRFPATFQVGTLYLDGRTCDLCFEVEDIGKHSLFAAASKIYLAYCEVTRPSTGQKRNICAAFTAGFAESLWVGRNGIFYDRAGNDWDAVIVKVIEHQISLKEAFWMPWRKIAAMISEQVKKFLEAKDAAAMAAASKSLPVAAVPPVAPAPAPAAGAAAAAGKKPDGAALAASVAAVGIAVGLIGSAVGGLVSTISGLPLWKTLLGVVGVILAVSAPSMMLAFFKLRARNVAPILNACGWAVNSNIHVTFPLGMEMTQEATLPPGSLRQLTDPYAERNSLRTFLLIVLGLVLVVYVCWRFGLLKWCLP